MRFEWDAEKNALNLGKHRLGLALAIRVLMNPLVISIYDRFQDGEHRYHALAWVGSKLLLAVHTFPDPDDDELVRIISLREATPLERRRYEEGDG